MSDIDYTIETIVRECEDELILRRKYNNDVVMQNIANMKDNLNELKACIEQMGKYLKKIERESHLRDVKAHSKIQFCRDEWCKICGGTMGESDDDNTMCAQMPPCDICDKPIGCLGNYINCDNDDCNDCYPTVDN
jgi:hypothetical protein